MQPRIAHVRRSIGITQHLFQQAFELPAADVFKIRALGPLSRRFVEIHRDSVALPDLASDVPRDGHAILDRCAFQGNKRNYVRRAQPGMLAAMARQIDQFGGLANPRSAASATDSGSPTIVITLRL